MARNNGRGSFEEFAQTPEYLEVNGQIVADWLKIIKQLAGAKGRENIGEILDLACGVGTTAKLIQEQLRSAAEALKAVVGKLSTSTANATRTVNRSSLATGWLC